MTSDRAPLDDARRRLYAGPRATFIDRRKELVATARRDGDRELATRIAAMRKPSTSAHLVNLLAQADDRSLHEVIELGATIRQAMAQGDNAAMRSLLRSRQTVIAGAVARAGEVAGANDESVTAAVSEQLAQTLRAAMASDDAAAAVLDGSLTDALDEPGFGGVSIGPASSAPAPAAARRRRAEGDTATADRSASATASTEVAAERAAARARTSSAVADVRRAKKALATLAKRRDGLVRTRDRLAAELAQIDDELAAANADVDAAEGELADATAEADAARSTGR